MRLRLLPAVFVVAGSLYFGGAQEATPAQTAPKAKTLAAGAKKPAGGAAAGSLPDAPAASSDTSTPSAKSTGGASSDQALPGAPTLTDAPSQATDAKGGPAAPGASAAPAGKKHSAAEDNPFPEEYSKEAAKEADGDAKASEAAKSGSPGASAAGGSSSQEGLDKLDLYGDKKVKKGKDADPNAGMAYDPKLAAQDDKIGELYLKNGDAPGAYSRFKEATQHDAGDATAILGLAESARRLNLLEEARQAYETYLFAFPEGSKSRAARNALAAIRLQEKK